jgi:uncharacterized protein YndB with AHSA1/START domain
MTTTISGTSFSTPSDTEVRVEREFDGPRELVFALMTDPALIPEWWGPRDQTVVVEEMDVREGGKWRYSSTGPDGTEITFSGEYLEVSPPERLAYTFRFSLAPGFETIERGELIDLGNGRTRFVTVATANSAEGLAGMLESGMQKGAAETYERFDELLARNSGRS